MNMESSAADVRASLDIADAVNLKIKGPTDNKRVLYSIIKYSKPICTNKQGKRRSLTCEQSEADIIASATRALWARIYDFDVPGLPLALPILRDEEEWSSFYKPPSGIHKCLEDVDKLLAAALIAFASEAAFKWKRKDDPSPPNDIENPKPPNDIEDSNLTKRILNPPKEVSEDPKPPEYSNLSERIINPPKVLEDPNPPDYSNLSKRILHPPAVSKDLNPPEYSNLSERILDPSKVLEDPNTPEHSSLENLPSREEISEDPNPSEGSNLSKRNLTHQVVSGDPNRSEDPNRLKGPNPSKDLSPKKLRFQLYLGLVAVITVMLQTFHQAVKPTRHNSIRLGASFGFLFGSMISSYWVFKHTGDRPINKWISFIFNLCGTMPIYLAYSMFIPEWYGWIGFPVLCIILAIVEWHEKLRKACKCSLEKCVSGVKFLGRCVRSSRD